MSQANSGGRVESMLEGLEPRLLLSAVVGPGGLPLPLPVDGFGPAITAPALPFPTKPAGSSIVSSTLCEVSATIAARLATDPLADVSGLAEPGFLMVDGGGNIQVYVYVAEVSQDAIQLLETAGLVVETSNADMHVIQGWVSYSMLETLGGVPGVRQIVPPSYPVCNTGSQNSLGDARLRASDVRNRFAAWNIDGRNVTIGVISDGVDNWTDVFTSQDLPDLTGHIDPAHPRWNQDWTVPCNEGTAMLEIVHDLAPGSPLFFSAPGSSTAMIDSINWLIQQGCNVIVDDLAFFDQPYFQEAVAGTISARVRDWVNAGGIYVTAAGNFAAPAGNWGESHYQQRFVDDGTGLHVFGGGGDVTKNMWVDAGATLGVSLQWSDPWGASGNNYDLFLVDGAGQPIGTGGTNVQNGTQNPFEWSWWTNTTGPAQSVGIVVWRNAGADPNRELELYTWGGGTGAIEYNTREDSIFGQGATAEAITVGAIDAAAGTTTVEFFSSRGPTNTYTTAQSFQLQTPDVRHFLDGCGSDDVDTAVGLLAGAPDPFVNPFFGTSAAAPHVAAIAALMLNADPNLTTAQISGVLNDTAVRLPGYAAPYDDTAGNGRFDALSAVYRVFNLLGPPDLAPEDDLGVNDWDHVTCHNTPTLVGTAPLGSCVRLYANGVEVGHEQLPANDSQYRIETSPLADGIRYITVRVGESEATAEGSLSNASLIGQVTIDTTSPTVTFGAVTSPRSTSVTQITVTFQDNDTVYNQDGTDLVLTRDAAAVDPAFASGDLTYTSGNTWTLKNLADKTGRAGKYELSIPGPNCNVTDRAGNPVALAARSWVMNTINGTAGNDTFTFADGAVQVVTTTDNYAVDLATFSATLLNVVSSGGNDTLILNLASGGLAPIPGGGISFNSGGGTDSLQINGSAVGDQVTLAKGEVRVNGSALLTYTSIYLESISLSLGAGDDTVTLDTINGMPVIPIQGIAFDGEGGNDTVQIDGVTGPDTVTLKPQQVTIGSYAYALTYSNVEVVSASLGAGNDVLNLTFSATASPIPAGGVFFDGGDGDTDADQVKITSPTGSSRADTVRLVAGQQAVAGAVVCNSVQTATVTLQGGDDTLTLDFTNGQPVTGAISFNAGGGTGDTVEVIGSGGTDTVTLVANKVTVEHADPAWVTNVTTSYVERVVAALGDGDDTLTFDHSSGQPFSGGVVLAGGIGNDTLEIIGPTTGAHKVTLWRGEAQFDSDSGLITYPDDDVEVVSVTLRAAVADEMVLNFTAAGSPVPSGGVLFKADGGTDKLTVTGSSGTDSLALRSGQQPVQGYVALDLVENAIVNLEAGDDTLILDYASGAPVSNSVTLNGGTGSDTLKIKGLATVDTVLVDDTQVRLNTYLAIPYGPDVEIIAADLLGGDDTLNVTLPLPSSGVVFDGGDGEDTLQVDGSTGNDGVTLQVGQQPVAGAVSCEAVENTFVDLYGGDDTLTLDYANGSPVPALGLAYGGGDGSDILGIKGSTGDDCVELQVGQVTVNAGPAISHEGVESLSMALGDGDDMLIVDLANGNPVPTGGVEFDGEGGAKDELQILGTPGADTVTQKLGQVLIESAVINYTTAVERVWVVLGAGDDTLTLDYTTGVGIPSGGIMFEAGGGYDTEWIYLPDDKKLRVWAGRTPGVGQTIAWNLDDLEKLCVVCAAEGPLGDTLEVDYANGNPLPSDGVAFYGGTGTDRVKILGSETEDETLVLTSGQVQMNSYPAVTYEDVERIWAALRTGTNNVQVNGDLGPVELTLSGEEGGGLCTLTAADPGYTDEVALVVWDSANAEFDSSLSVASLTLYAGTQATLASGGSKVLLTNALSIQEIDGVPTAQLDLTDNDLIVDYDDTSPLESIIGWIAAGYKGMAWDGNGIVSSVAASNPITCGLGYAQNDILFEPWVPYEDFDGFEVDESTILVKFTYLGDLNLDGCVNDNDVTVFSLFYDGGAEGGHYWHQGDIFGYDGRINDNDVTVLGLNYGLGIGNPL